MLIQENVEMEKKPLGIPYFKHDPKAHSYLNLRQQPEMISALPELRDCPPLLEFVKALNADSPFETFGCDRGEMDFSNDDFPGFTRGYGSYLEIASLEKDR